jgi:DNA-nicking Smr family endonuclease
VKRSKPPQLDPPRRPRDRKLTSEEESLWAQVAASIAPDRKAKPRVRKRGRAAEIVAPELTSEADASTKPASRSAPVAPREEESAAARPRSAAAKPFVPPQASPKPKAPPLAEFDRRKVRHIARGKVEIDARIDLHGLRQSEARYRLIGFLHSAQARGHRTVLVITGKGSTTPVDPLAYALGEPQRGVLRRLVPQWLGEPDLRTLVVSFTTASLRHGGDGALYVHLRRG